MIMYRYQHRPWRKIRIDFMTHAAACIRGAGWTILALCAVAFVTFMLSLHPWVHL